MKSMQRLSFGVVYLAPSPRCMVLWLLQARQIEEHRRWRLLSSIGMLTNEEYIEVRVQVQRAGTVREQHPDNHYIDREACSSC